MNNRITVWSYKYPTETSPTIKGIVSYLADRSLIDNFIADHSSSFPDVNTITTVPVWIDNIYLWFKNIFEFFPKKGTLMWYLNKVKTKIEHRFISYKLKKINKDDIVFCMEFHSLFMLYKIGFPLSQVVYFSLECEAVISEYDKCFVNGILSQCAFCVIQSKERAEGLEKYLGTTLSFEYLPVSLRPVKISNNTRKNKNLKIIHSGYFATWSCLKEFINAYKDTVQSMNYNVVLQGHAIGTEDYLNEITSMVNKNIKIDSKYYNDKDHIDLLRNFDIGIALYARNEQSPNWNNLIFSSGKIATYLWAGIPVITNVKSSLTQSPPFLYIKDITRECLEDAFERYSQERMIYHLSAVKCANKFYNLDFYMDNIIERLSSHTGVRKSDYMIQHNSDV